MRICIVTQYFWPERFKINDIAKGLVEKGHEVIVLTGLPNYPIGKFEKGYSYLGPYKEVLDGVKIIRVPLITRGHKKGIRLALNYISFFISGSILAPLLVRGRIDRIFVYQLSPVLASFPAVVLKFIKRAPILFWVTDLWPETLEATGAVKSEKVLRIWGHFVKFLYNCSDHILVSSNGFIKKINERGVPLKKIDYWPQWGEKIFSENIVLPNLDITKEIPSGFIVMFAGNIGTSQSFDTIIEAATILKNNKNIKWVILGDGLVKEWLIAEVAKRELSDQFFILGSRPMEQMPTYYSKANILLASLNSDPLFSITVPAKIQSYLPSGKPIIASMNGEGADLVNISQSGISSPADCPIGLSNAILELYNLTEEERDQLGSNGKKYFVENFERENLLLKLDHYLASLCEKQEKEIKV